MRVLIVEDNAEKALQIMAVVTELGIAPPTHVRGLRAAYPALEHNKYDLVILDMTLHAAEGQRSVSNKESLAGIEVLQAIAAAQDDALVLVATQHDVFRQETLHFRDLAELDRALSEAFPLNYRGVVRVSLGSEDWKRDMTSKILCCMR